MTSEVYTCIPRSNIAQRDWDAIVSNSPDGWVWALSGWQDTLLAVPEWSFVDFSFGVLLSGRLVAVVPLQHSPQHRAMACSGFGLTAPAISQGLGAGERRQCQSYIFKKIADQARELGIAGVEFALHPTSQSSRDSAWGVNPLVHYGLRDTSGHSLVLDLEPSEGELLAQLDQDARQSIRRARNAGYTVRVVDWEQSVESYYELHRQTYGRSGATPHPKAYFAGIASRVARTGNSALYAAFAPDGRPVAYHNSARLGQGGMYHTGCSHVSALNARANYILFWEVLLDSRRKGLRWYELGEVFPGQSSGKLAGLATFKSKFGGNLRRNFRAVLDVRSPETSVAAPGAFQNWLSATARLAETIVGTKAVALLKKGIGRK